MHFFCLLTHPDSGIGFLSSVFLRVLPWESSMTLPFAVITKTKSTLHTHIHTINKSFTHENLSVSIQGEGGGL